MLQLAICDRSSEYRRQLSELLEERLQTIASEVELFSSAEELLRYLNAGYAPDIAVLGISDEVESAVSLAEELNVLSPACRIIFVSDELRFATEVYRADHVWFLLRGELDSRIGPALRKALSSLDSFRSRGIVIRSRARANFVPLDDVLYVERVCRQTLVRTEKEIFSSSERPNRLLSGGLSDQFIHCHRSYWVNKSRIEALEHEDFVLTNGERIPISRSRRAAAREAFFDISR